MAVLPYLSDYPGCQYTETGGLVLGMRFRTNADGVKDYEIEKVHADAVTVAASVTGRSGFPACATS